jgi:UDP-N-acetylglucosamine diphosphorylase/glucosamine-1-phosphate N-acetyltransferase
MIPSPIYLFEDSQVARLHPLTYARSACELRVGSMTLLERIQKILANLGHPLSGLAEVLQQRLALPVNPSISTRDGILLLNSRLLTLASTTPWSLPPPNSAGLAQSAIAWLHLDAELAEKVDFSKLQDPHTLEAILPLVQRLPAPPHAGILIDRPWDLLDHQKAAILEDFAAVGPANHATLLPGVHLLRAEHIHLAPGVKIWPGAVLDAQNGPILIGADTEIRANAVITGPVAIGPQCIIRTGADIRENCSFGPGSRVGGEVSHSLFLGHASKQHHGFLGQTIVGEWVNLGAGTTTSNLKNTYGPVRMPLNNTDEPTGKQFLGSLIADHAKIAIGTYLSTGSVIGFASHILTPRPPRFVPSFAWVTDKSIARADFEKIEQIAGIAMNRRDQEFTLADHNLFIRIAAEYAQIEDYPWPDR